MEHPRQDFLEALSPESRARVEREPVHRQEQLAAEWRKRLQNDAEPGEEGTDFLVPGMSHAGREAEYVVSTALEQFGES
ncbi:hypothetical protein ACF06X_08790 [Streptomyces sp. NPDC015346]|uniref:hypothetical protein n=1 Tax=Streptomyces sp. NPDC015346 TaxID=3364954 RepID=UPI0036F621EE